ncbi:hypothetical protein I302_102524 [Kwoniella bestiolae CBS 10118]|uniref:Uncharacterized protein n=1 Tax=Kwoniella bestiolae CBS 10118 TaxID=1296100 RepID=A0A1B9GF81_9TREE|nr:hypothetical protein I302_01214 [Kwoniella bestiolae CBS 10118]OCF29702.1 hypothetical protein I302_01214 [Kwoniella bestiolae CBS 10118]
MFRGEDPSLDFMDEYIARQFGKAGPSGVKSDLTQGTTPIGLAGKEEGDGDGGIGQEMGEGGGFEQVQAEKTDEEEEEEGSKAEGGESGGSKDGTSPTQVSAGNEAEVAEEEYSIEVVVTLVSFVPAPKRTE